MAKLEDVYVSINAKSVRKDMAVALKEFKSQMEAAIDEAREKFIKACGRSLETLQE